MRLINSCKFCHKKNVAEIKHSTRGTVRFITLECGHTYTEKLVAALNETPGAETKEIILKDGRKLYPFQVEGVHLAERSNFRCQISDEMGLGKTVQALAAIDRNYEALKPILILVKSSLTVNWLRELVLSTGKFAQIFESGDELIPGIQIVIVSFDTLTPRKIRSPKEKSIAKDTFITLPDSSRYSQGFNTDKGSYGVSYIEKVDDSNLKKIIAFSPKTVILDEVQMLKNHSAKRTNAIRELVRSCGTKHIVGLSGTPIKNNALEYFPILNILRPEMFPSLKHFEYNYVDYYWNGKSYKPGGLKYPEEFLAKTKDFIIRRTREEVLPDLPKIQRDFKFYAISDSVKKAYSAKVKKLGELLRDNEGEENQQFYTDLIAQLSLLRHITGLAKIEPTLDLISSFLEEEEEDKKLVVFHHHKDVGDILSEKLFELTESKTGILRLLAEQDANERTTVIEAFRVNPHNRVLFIPTLAGGEGINLQFVQNAIIMEREWNPANEEQAEGRFSRIGSVATSILVIYPTATGTIDEYFAEIVERKRQYIAESLNGSASTTWDNSSVMLELANTIVKKWSI